VLPWDPREELLPLLEEELLVVVLEVAEVVLFFKDSYSTSTNSVSYFYSV
jgi:hypothetical protein